MIEKLRKRIFYIIMVSLSAIVLGTIIVYSTVSYRNSINATISMVDRFVQMPELERKERRMEELNNSNLPNNELNVDVENRKNTENNGNAEDIVEQEKLQPKNKMQNSDVEGVYFVMLEDSKVISNSDTSNSSDIEEYARKVSQRVGKTGIIGNYVYKVEKGRNSETNVILVENTKTITHVKTIIITSIVIAVLALIVIYILAKFIADLLVRPVRETFEKQKQFISDASHELKTPLAVIEANADVLENEIGDNKWIKYIQNEIDSMSNLISELLLLAKVENVDNLRETEKFDLSKQVEISLSVFESMAYEKNVKIKSNIQENIIFNGNKNDIDHVISTLTDNAIKHSEKGKTVEVSLNKIKNDIIIEVKNEGEPIPKDEREKIFERFYRIDKSRNRKEKRYGLGLAIANSIVKKYKGKIEVDCNNGFTSFTVIIPA